MAMKKLYVGGTILTMDKSCPSVEAVLTENGRIVAAGDYQSLEASDAVLVDLQGKTLMPAFVDGHSHAIGVGLNLNHSCDLTGCGDFEELLNRIRRFRKEKNLIHGENIQCRGYDPAILKEGCHPTAAILDSLNIDNPVACIHQSGHMAVYNSAAMKKAGVDRKNFVCPEGGLAGRDETGQLNGYFEENARNAVSFIFASDYCEEDIKKAILTAQDYYIKHGYTTIQDGSMNQSLRISCLDQLAESGQLKVDFVAYLTSAPGETKFWEHVLKTHGRGYKNRLKIGGVKMFLDGSPQARTAWLTKPYQGETEYKGYPILTDEQVQERLKNSLAYGLQTLAHCNGDAASEQFLSCFERVSAEMKEAQDCRPVMIHSQTVRYDQLERMRKIGMMPSFFIGHCYYWGDTHIKNLGDRGYRISPIRKALDFGLPVSLHQDSPVTPPDMLHSIWCAVNRVSRNGVVVGAENKIDCYDALIAATNGGAYTYFEEETKGILKKNAVADFVILDQDPTSVDPMKIKDIKVLETIKEDKEV